MKLEDLTAIDQLVDFLSGTEAVAFSVISDKDACCPRAPSRCKRLTLYRWIQGELVKFRHLTLSRYGKGVVIRYLMKISGYCPRAPSRGLRPLTLPRQQLTRQRHHVEKTQSKPSRIGERRKPRPNGRPGYIRIDTVHQGDLDKQKGVYHINAVDEVTQFEVVCTVEKISALYLIPALEQLLETFPFTVLGFHSDNGSEYINKRAAELLEKLHIEFTKSRSRHSNDNALAERKNGAMVRKLFGYSHIPQR